MSERPTRVTGVERTTIRVERTERMSIDLQVSENGAASVYELKRFPVTLICTGRYA